MFALNCPERGPSEGRPGGWRAQTGESRSATACSVVATGPAGCSSLALDSYLQWQAFRPVTGGKIHRACTLYIGYPPLLSAHPSGPELTLDASWMQACSSGRAGRRHIVRGNVPAMHACCLPVPNDDSVCWDLSRILPAIYTHSNRLASAFLLYNILVSSPSLKITWQLFCSSRPTPRPLAGTFRVAECRPTQHNVLGTVVRMRSVIRASCVDGDPMAMDVAAYYVCGLAGAGVWCAAVVGELPSESGHSSVPGWRSPGPLIGASL